MNDPTISTMEDWDSVAKKCEDCDGPLDYKALEHGLEGFGHQGRCCDCYERRMRGDGPAFKRKRPAR